MLSVKDNYFSVNNQFLFELIHKLRRKIAINSINFRVKMVSIETISPFFIFIEQINTTNSYSLLCKISYLTKKVDHLFY